MEGAEWNTAAVGPDKRGLADTLIRRLKDRFAPGGLLPLRPGQMVSRRKPAALGLLSVLARRRPAAVAQRQPHRGREIRSRAELQKDARDSLAEGIARRLDLKPDYVLPAYEDPWHYLGKEQALPVNVDPFDSKLEDKEERARLARVFERGLKNPTGFVLAGTALERGRHTAALALRTLADAQRPPAIADRGRFISLGFRLPLGSLPWVPPAERARFRTAAGSVRAIAASAARRRFLSPALSFRGTMRDPLSGKARRASTMRTGSAHRRRDMCSTALSASSRATDASASSCRRRRRRPIISTFSPPSRTPPPNRAPRFTSRAIRRPTIRASTSSR